MRVLHGIFTYHEERSLCSKAVERIEDEGRCLWYGTVVESEIDDLPMRLYPPQSVGIEPTEDFRRLFNEHDADLHV